MDDSDPDTSLFINVCRDIGRFGGGGGEGFLRRLQYLCPSAIIPSWNTHVVAWAPDEAGKMCSVHDPTLGSQSVLIPVADFIQDGPTSQCVPSARHIGSRFSHNCLPERRWEELIGWVCRAPRDLLERAESALLRGLWGGASLAGCVDLSLLALCCRPGERERRLVK